MIEVLTATRVEATGFDKDFVSAKRVVVEMSADDAFAVASVLLNNQLQITDDWKGAISRFSYALVKAGNACR